MAHVVDAILRQQMMMRHAQAGQRRRARHRAKLLDVGAGEDRRDARRGKCGLGVDAFDSCRAVRAADDAGVMHPGHLEIVQVERGAGDQPRIFLAADALAEERLGLGDCGRHGSGSSRFGRGFHGVDNVLVSRAAAEIALEAVADLLLGRDRIVGEQLPRGENHPRRTKSALQRMFIPERLLQRVELAVLRQPLDRQHVPSFRLDREMVQLLTAMPSSMTVQAPQIEVSQPMCGPVSPATSRR